VLSQKVGLYLENDETVWEQAPMRRLAAEGELCAFRHKGFFQPMDTQRDHTYLEQVRASGYAPWRCW
jgi:glucose-1-phosphate cytidylyltransferase